MLEPASIKEAANGGDANEAVAGNRERWEKVTDSQAGDRPRYKDGRATRGSGRL
jgi:hypothetical protein